MVFWNGYRVQAVDKIYHFTCGLFFSDTNVVLNSHGMLPHQKPKQWPEGGGQSSVPYMSKLCTEKVTFIKIMATLRDTAGAWGSLYFCLTRCHTRHNTGSFPQVTTFKYICHSNPTHHTRIKGRKQSTRYRKARKYTAVQPDIFPHAYQKSWTIHI